MAEIGSGNDLKTFGKRPVRTRMRGVVGAGGEKPAATRFSVFMQIDLQYILGFQDKY